MSSLLEYTVLEELYYGEKSIIYRVQKDDRFAIVKSLKNDYPSASELNAFKQESDLLLNIVHPGVVKLIGTEKYNNSFVILFEDIGGNALSNLLQGDRKFSLSQVLSICLKIATGLAEIHRANIVHRDIKPHNVILNEKTGEVNIIDFGSASLSARQNSFIPSSDFLEGTLAYISPEQTGRTNRMVDYRTDFYSLGITMYELLVEYPFSYSDSMELVHAHIAKIPASPHEKNNTPEIVSEIVMKLLEKNPEDRYQNVNGLIYDLEWCLKNVRDTRHGFVNSKVSINNEKSSFKIGEKDYSGKFQIPEKLYGRTREITQIINTFKNASKGNVELLLISGPSGIGKSILINELNKPILEINGYFITGKYDQFKRSIPYRAITHAFQGLIQQILSEKAESILRWKKKILTAVGSNGKVLIDVIPELESLLGSQEDVPSLGKEESQNRFNFVFQNFIEVLCTKEHPLAIFLDDLQWADLPSIKLIQNILADSELKHLLLMLSFRDNEVFANDSLSLMLENIKKVKFQYREISLEPISLLDIHTLVTETLSCEKEKCRELAEILYSKTTGNPFFVNTLFKSLHDKGLIYFFEEKWKWDIQKIQEVEISENVIDLMGEKVKELPDSLIEVLKFAACLGNDFKADNQAQIEGKDLAKLNFKLQILSNEGFFIMSGNNARFAHDKIREAIYSMMSEDEKINSHYRIGKWWLENTPKKMIEENIFSIVGQLNHGKQLITSLEERLTLISLNLKAGKKAKISTAYDGALNFLHEGVNLLLADKWEKHYSLTLEIYSELVECEYLATHFEEANILYDYILKKARTLHDKIPIYQTMLRQRAGEGKGQEAFLIGFRILEELGFKMPDIFDPIAIKKTFIEQLGEYEQLRGENPISNLFYLPEMKDEKALEAISLITALGDISISLKPEMLGLMSILGVNLSLKYGNTNVSPISYVMWGVITNLTFLDYKSGYELGQLSIKLNEEKFPSGLIFGKSYSFYGWNIHHWVHHVKEDLQIAQKGYEIAMANSDLISGSFLIAMSFIASYYVGMPLKDVLDFASKAFLFAEKYKQPFLKVFVTASIKSIHALQGNTNSNTSFDSKDFDEVSFINENRKFGQPMAYFYFRKLQIYFLFGAYEKCLDILPNVELYFPNIPHHIVFAEFHFYNALILTRKMPDFSMKDKEVYSQKLNESLDFLRVWSSLCEDNFLHQYLLVEAETARMAGKEMEAMQLYDKSIASASKYEYTNNAALANELAAGFYFSKGLEKVAAVYLQEAHYLFQVWGATAKVKELEKKYPNLKRQWHRSKDSDLDVIINAKKATTIGNSSSGQFLDLHTVIKASQAISGEIQLGKLLERMIKIILENAGAERGFFLLKENNNWYIKAEGNANTEKIEIFEEKTLEGNSDLCTSIVNYVVHARHIVLLSDAARKGIFTNDDYVKRKQPKSILCYPVINQGNLLGVVYLENNLSTGAFTSDRTEILNILSSQIALSLENSLLYANLEEKVAERTKDLEITLDNLKLTQNELVQSEKMAALGQLIAGVAHEINTPIGAISSSMESVQGFLDKDFQSVLEFFIKARQEERDFMEKVLFRQSLHKAFISSKEKRQAKMNLEKLLKAEEIEDAVVIADHLTDMGIFEDLEEFLPIIKKSGAVLLDKVYKLSILRKGLSNIQLATDKTSKIVFALKSYSHRESSGVKTRARIDIGIDTVLTLYQNVLNRGIELIKVYSTYIPEIECYPDELNQVWINLIQNSIHAMDSKGKLTIGIMIEDSSLKVEITDTGKGIPVEVAGKIFQPFFTTKPTGEGSGLGLGIVEKILEKHEGSISFMSEPGNTKFIILLPIK